MGCDGGSFRKAKKGFKSWVADNAPWATQIEQVTTVLIWSSLTDRDDKLEGDFEKKKKKASDEIGSKE